jgi:hypothetical protein
MVVELVDVDPQRLGGDLRRQAAVEGPEVVEERLVVIALAIGVVRSTASRS